MSIDPALERDIMDALTDVGRLTSRGESIRSLRSGGPLGVAARSELARLADALGHLALALTPGGETCR